jgi:hypothetical protein
MAALIARMLVVRVGDVVKDGAISAVTRVFDALWRRRLRRSSILDQHELNAVQAIKAAFWAFRAISHGVVPREALDFYRLRPDMRGKQGYGMRHDQRDRSR